MPRRSKGARLYLREARADRSAKAVWIIRDGSREVSTGCGEGGLQSAERALALIDENGEGPGVRLRKERG